MNTVARILQAGDAHRSYEWVNLIEAAVWLHTTPRAVRKQMQRGHLPGVKRAGRWYVALTDLPTVGRPTPARRSRRAAPEVRQKAPWPDLVDVLKDEVQFLRRALAERTEELQILRDLAGELRAQRAAPAEPPLTATPIAPLQTAPDRAILDLLQAEAEAMEAMHRELAALREQLTRIEDEQVRGMKAPASDQVRTYHIDELAARAAALGAPPQTHNAADPRARWAFWRRGPQPA